MRYSTKNVVLIVGGLLALAVVSLTLVLFLLPNTTRQTEALVQTIRKAVLTGDVQEGEAAYDLLKEVGPAAIPVASRLFHERDASVRACGAELVQELIEDVRKRHQDGDAPAEVLETIPVLIAALRDENEAVRSEAASALGWVGPEALVALPALRDALQDPSRRVQAKAERALERIQVK